MYILGISGLEHDSAAALVGDRGVIAAIEEDKLARTPRLGGVPRLAMEYALRQAGVDLSGVEALGLATHPRRTWLREERFRVKVFFSRPGAARHTGALGRAYRAGSYLRILHSLVPARKRIFAFEHHWCHAASAYYPSPFDQALVLTLDEAGDMWSGLLAMGQGDDMRPLAHMDFPNSLGWFFTRMTEVLGLRPRLDEQKTQWLGRNGTPDLVAVFRKFFRSAGDGTPVLDRRYLGSAFDGQWHLSEAARREMGLKDSQPPSDLAFRAAIARSAQEFLEEAVVSLAQKYRTRTGARHLALAGGVFMNSLLVRAIEDRAGFHRVFVQPAAGNAGTSLGAAYLVRRRLTGSSGRTPLTALDWGPEFGKGEVKEVLDNTKVIYRYLPHEEELLEATVSLLRQDKIVGWCRGRAEFGLRALGNRSLLASPFSPYSIENLNRYIKHRAEYHPFALSVTAEAAPGLFDAGPNCRFLCSMADLRGESQELAAFTFRGRQVRLQVVDSESNPRFWRLLQAFGQAAPAPVLVNASYNLFGEPLVVTARDALRSFYCSGTDALVLGNFLVVK